LVARGRVPRKRERTARQRQPRPGEPARMLLAAKPPLAPKRAGTKQLGRAKKPPSPRPRRKNNSVSDRIGNPGWICLLLSDWETPAGNTPKPGTMPGLWLWKNWRRNGEPVGPQRKSLEREWRAR